jgi:hypothetical protein
LNDSAPTAPLPAPVIDQVVSDAGPPIASFPEPPLKLIEIGAPTALVSTVSVSARSPPTIVTPVRPMVGRDEGTPSRVTTMSVALAEMPIW